LPKNERAFVVGEHRDGGGRRVLHGRLVETEMPEHAAKARNKLSSVKTSAVAPRRARYG
jgi:hypothetical protein